jgi:hypothetical protein
MMNFPELVRKIHLYKLRAEFRVGRAMRWTPPYLCGIQVPDWKHHHQSNEKEGVHHER